MFILTERRRIEPFYINVVIRYEDMELALALAKRKTGIWVTTQLIRQLIWDKAYGNE